ncbi:MAG: hypothetical protein BWX92_02093 [Deltaproteobacteria bacterium ADurb.Bin135]|jgi:hypothetical protein|nr:MAG: hypothetical protein BWX92_02093 [Deltaproteobacteria bacterium ADurb.Bin135]
MEEEQSIRMINSYFEPAMIAPAATDKTIVLLFQWITSIFVTDDVLSTKEPVVSYPLNGNARGRIVRIEHTVFDLVSLPGQELKRRVLFVSLSSRSTLKIILGETYHKGLPLRYITTYQDRHRETGKV